MGCSQTHCDRPGREEEHLPSMTHLLICANLELGEHCADFGVFVSLCVCVCVRERAIERDRKKKRQAFVFM